MSELLKTMLTPAWIISTVVVGVLLNIFSGYLKEGLDRCFSHMSKRREESSARRAREWRKLLVKLHNEPIFRTRYRVKTHFQAYVTAVATVSGLSSLSVLCWLGTAFFKNANGLPVEPTRSYMLTGVLVVTMLLLSIGIRYAITWYSRTVDLIYSELPLKIDIDGNSIKAESAPRSLCDTETGAK